MKNFEQMMDLAVNDLANPRLPLGFEERTLGRLKGSAASVNFAAEVPERNIVASILDNLRDVLWPRTMPPLVLESRAIAVLDSMAGERNSRAMIGAVFAHAAVILVIGWVVQARTGIIRPVRIEEVVALDAPLPPRTLPSRITAGGGGGQAGPTPATQGHLPKFAEQQIVPPMMVPPIDRPKIAMEPTIEVQKDLKMAENTLPNLGMPQSPLVGMSLGSGRGTGIGVGLGPGAGPGVGGNFGGGPRRVGGGVSEPKVIFQPEAEFSEEARRAKFSGNVLVYLWVDEHGNPTHIRVARSVGLGLDEKAVEAVRQYKFKPALENGRAVTVEMYVDVDFHIL